MTRNGNVKTPHDAMKMQNENEAIGTHAKPSKVYPNVFRYVYNPRQDKPIEAPPDEIANKILEKKTRYNFRSNSFLNIKPFFQHDQLRLWTYMPQLVELFLQ